MKGAKWFPYLVLSSILLGGCTQSNSKDSFSDLQEVFKNPPSEYRSVPFWVWNAKMKKSDIDRMLIDFKAKGFGGVFVTPRYGLITEYLSKEWFDLFEYSKQQAKKMGIALWLYDDNAYPSGFAGGRLPAEMPQCNEDGVALLPSHYMQLPADAQAAYVVLRRNGENFEDITSRLNDFAGEIGDFFVYSKINNEKSDWYAGYSYVDLLRKGVTEKFLEITMSGYQKRFGKEFGKTIPGVFSDEPNINAPANSIRWTPDLFPLFKKTFGYDLTSNLVSLHEEVGDYRRIRHDYFQLLITLFVERWAKPCSDYYSKNNLQWTGHYWEHEWPRLGSVPENMVMISWMQIPGLDLLFNRFDETDPRAQFGNIRLVKEASSIASQMGKKRVLGEIYGGGGWDLTFKDQKRLGDWAYVHGINFMTQHLSHTSYLGTRKYDYPPMFNAAAPWWKDYKILNDYYARLSTALSMGDEINNILLIEPTSTIWMYGMYLGELPEVRNIAQKFHDLIQNMSKSQLEFDLGSEELMKTNAKVKDSCLVIGKCSYKTIIIPPLVENIEAKTFELLKKFVKGGGTLIAFSMPQRLSGCLNYDVTSFFGNSKIRIINDEDMQALKKNLPSSSVQYERSWTGNLFHMRRQYKDGELFFFVNSDMDASESVEVKLDAKSVLEMDAFTGEIYQYPFDADKGVIRLNLEPASSKLLFVSKRYKEGKLRTDAVANRPIQAVSPLKRSRVSSNFLTIDYVDLKMGGKTYPKSHVLQASDQAFKNAGFPDGNPWFMKIQFKRNIIKRDTFMTKGFSVVYRFLVDKSLDYSQLEIAIERPSLYEILLNGKVVTVPKNSICLFDQKLLQIPVGDKVKPGENILELKVNKFRVYAVIEPVYVVGNFDVKLDRDRFSITQCQTQSVLGAWRDIGCPFYPYAMAYSKIYHIKDVSNKQFVVKAPNWRGTVAEVWINKKKAGIIFSNPFELNVTNALKPGENLVELHVIGGLDNLIGPFHVDPKGLTEPACWKGITQTQQASKYRFTPYGLWSDFELLSN